MLGRSAETPRPRPPGRTRRSTSSLNTKTGSPPPAYAPSFAFPSEQPKSILGSPLAATFQKFNWDSVDNTTPVEGEHEWMNEKSQEELTELLAKADGLIKERENELSLTSAVYRDLFESNVALKSKHKALLARLPSTRESSPDILSSPTRLDGAENRLSLGEMDGFYTPTRPSANRRHTRRISMSTNDISMLADQNAELLQKLEKLELESTRADQAGRRELRRLEKEIAYLKDELEKSQARDEELGWKAEKAVEEAWKKRNERDNKVKTIRNLGRDFHSDSSHQVKNFAPEGSRFGGPSEGFSFFPAPQDSRVVSPSRDITSASEKAVISQLLEKMKELETTNARILEQQTRTADELQAVHKETEQINKVYEYLSDPEQVQLEFETPQKGQAETPSHDNTSNTIRFHSFRRTLESELDVPRLSLRRYNTPQRRASRPPSKSRKSIVGLFDDINSNSETDLSLEDDTEVTTDQHSTPLAVNRLKHLKHETATREVPSPALSTLNLFSPSQLGASRPTLDNELGAEFTDSWGAHAGNFHLRTSSLVDLTQLAPISPTPVHYSRMSALGLTQGSGVDDLGESHEVTRTSAGSPNDIFTLSESSAPKSPRYQRMTEAIRSRTGRWADSRFKDTLSDRARPDQVNNGPSNTTAHAVVPGSLSKPLDVVENMPNAVADNSSSATAPPKAVELRSEPEKRRNGIAAIILEIWLWLQFIIIIVVFVWAMAKRGPKSVLRDAAERKALSRRT